MKFRNKETGEVLEDLHSVRATYCGKYETETGNEYCEDCPLSYRKNEMGEICSVYIHSNMKNALEKIGFEIINEDEKEKGGEKKVTRQSMLDDARRCVCGDRDQQYGSPENSFKAIGALWEVYIRHSCVSADAIVSITPEDVAAMMVLFKCARIATGQSKADNWVDIAGYAACGGEIGGSK